MKLNGKNLSVLRLLERGKDAVKRLQYLHVGPKGTTVLTPHALCRVSLPKQDSTAPAILLPRDAIQKLPRLAPENESLVIECPEGIPAITTPDHAVPEMEKMLLGPGEIDLSFTVNGELLRRMLTIACEVNRDSDKTLRLRVCKKKNLLRIDNYRQPGTQEFVGVIQGMEYDGNYIPGEPETDKDTAEKKPTQAPMVIKVSSGRKFRGVE